MHLMCRAAGLLLLLTSTLVVSAGPASAAAPSNDTVASAIAITPGWTGFIDLATATLDETEASFAQRCGYQITSAVWYKYTSTSLNDVYFDGLAARTYGNAGVLVAVGSPDSLSPTDCPFDSSGASIAASPGNTYYLMVFYYAASWELDSQYNLLLVDATSKPQFDITFTRAARNQIGWALVTMNVSCSNSRYANIGLTLTQRQRKSFVSGDGGVGTPTLICDGTQREMTVTVKGDGPFVGGTAMVTSTVYARNHFSLVSSNIGSTQVRLRGVRR